MYGLLLRTCAHDAFRKLFCNNVDAGTYIDFTYLDGAADLLMNLGCS